MRLGLNPEINALGTLTVLVVAVLVISANRIMLRQEKRRARWRRPAERGVGHGIAGFCPSGLHAQLVCRQRAAPGPAASLRGEVSAEVCVIGGGYTGLSTALELAERGSAWCCWKARLGWAASGRNGGQVLSDLACGMDAVRAELGAEAARAIWDDDAGGGAHGGRALPALRHRRRFALGYLNARRSSRASCASWPTGGRAPRDYGYEALRLVEQAGLSALVDSPRYVGGLFDPNCGHLHPLKYALGLACAALVAGVRVYEHSRHRALSRGRRR